MDVSTWSGWDWAGAILMGLMAFAMWFAAVGALFICVHETWMKATPSERMIAICVTLWGALVLLCFCMAKCSTIGATTRVIPCP